VFLCVGQHFGEILHFQIEFQHETFKFPQLELLKLFAEKQTTQVFVEVFDHVILNKEA
jgi:hypothetical protein